MAAQKKPAGRASTARAGSQARSGQAASRAGASTARQRSATATPKANGNGPVPGKSRSGGGAATRARPATGQASARGGPAAAAVTGTPAGPVGRLLAPLRSIGPVPLATFVLSLYALGASTYLTINHFDASVALVCSDKGLVNCAEVTTSPQSMVFGIFPVAVLGLAYYLFMTVLNSPWLWRLQQTGSEQVSKILRSTRLGAIVVGMGFVLYLVYAELIQIRAICLWCTSVHVATFLIFVLIVFYTSLSPGRPGQAARA